MKRSRSGSPGAGDAEDASVESRQNVGDGQRGADVPDVRALGLLEDETPQRGGAKAAWGHGEPALVAIAVYPRQSFPPSP